MRTSWTVALLGALVIASVARADWKDDPAWSLAGRWVGRDVNDPQRREYVLELRDPGGRNPRGGRWASGTMTVSSPAPTVR